MFLPTTKQELERLGWDSPDVILVSGDTYIDSPYSGVAVIGRVLAHGGYRTGIIAQPDIHSPVDITRLGEPRLFWGITGGAMDSLVANYTATGKFRNSDDSTPGGVNNRRPDRAVIAYANLIRRYFKQTVPLVLGGVEASLRRIAHYDYWSGKVRNSILFDAKGDILVYGMGEKTVLSLAQCLDKKLDYRQVKGLCFIDREPVEGYCVLPGAEQVKHDKKAFLSMFSLFNKYGGTPRGSGMVQQHGDRFLIHNPPAEPLSGRELDEVHALPFEFDVHPFYKGMGIIRALDTIRFSVITHRGCIGNCHFCAINLHQGNMVVSRSVSSIEEEVRRISRVKGFKGNIADAGGATANMYGIRCSRHVYPGFCTGKSCLYPEICPHLEFSHESSLLLLGALRTIPGIKKVFIASGIRHDLVVADKKYGRRYVSELLKYHTSGQLKIAPEHVSQKVCGLMNKPGADVLLQFKKLFDSEDRGSGAGQFLTYYFIAAHPGCGENDMKELRRFIETHLKVYPEQVQIFTPVPSTWSTALYYTGIHPVTGEKVFVERDNGKKMIQKHIIMKKPRGAGALRIL